MSYQNVGTPRFYVDVFSYLNAIGLVDVIGSNSLGENLNVTNDDVLERMLLFTIDKFTRTYTWPIP